MAEVNDAVEAYCRAMMTMDIATLMGSMTPEALGKAMAAMGGGGGPGGGGALQSYEIDAQGQDGDEHVFHLKLVGSDQTGTVMTKWKQIDGAWKVSDIALLEGS
jgi:hypothetical protein